jgi:hypothetical protein
MHNRLRIHVTLALISLFLSFMLWLIAMQGELSTDWLTINLKLEDTIPLNMKVEPDVNQVEINLQFLKNSRQRMVSKNFEVRLDAMKLFSEDPAVWAEPDQKKIEKYELGPDNVHLRGVRNVKILKIEPPEINLVASLYVRRGSIDVITTGTLSPNWTLVDKQAEPSEVWITAPPGKLESFEQHGSSIRTVPVDLSTLSGSGPKFPELIVPDDLIVLNQQTDRHAVHFALEETKKLETIHEVPIIPIVIRGDLTAAVTPSTVDVVVFGPVRTLEKLTKNDFRLTPATTLVEETGQKQDTGVRPEWASSVSRGIRSQVDIRECIPPRITVEFSLKLPEDEPGQLSVNEDQEGSATPE